MDEEDTPDGELWADDHIKLERKLERRYGYRKLWLQGFYHDKERNELVEKDALMYYNGEDRYLIKDEIGMLGHGDGGWGVEVDTLPDQDAVDEVVETADQRCA